MSNRVTDSMVTDWLIWARNFGEIVAYSTGKGPYKYAKKGESRRFRIRLTPGVTKDGTPFRPKGGILDIFGHTPEDVVPSEMMLTAREALVFGMGCAAGRAAALSGVAAESAWQRENWWTPEQQAEFKARREEAREEVIAEQEREHAEWEAERQAGIAAYRARKEVAQRGTEIEAAKSPQLERGDDA
jgi:hypothetical protein